ncbi:MAG: metallophosphoesterase [bacterium]|nr:metallophosphoesterase [bacterium]
MFILYILIPLLVMIPVGIYLYFYLLRMAEFFHLDRKKKWVKRTAGAIAIVLMIISVNVFGIGSVAILHVVVISLIMEGINRLVKEKKVWKNVYRSGLVPILLTAIILTYGFFNIRNVVETDYSVYTEKDIRQEGYRVAMISDLHYGTTMNEKKLQSYCDKISQEKPDLVVLCGDIVDEDTTKEEMQSALKILSSIKSTYGTYYVYGNHDLNNYASKPNYTKEQLKEELEQNSIRILKDETVTISNDFAIVGRNDIGFAKEEPRKSNEDLMREVDQKDFILLLDHQPCELKENDQTGFDLQLSGHTHNGQIWPVGILSKLFGINEMSYGYKQFSHMQVIVSSGMAGWGYPVRTESHSEYVIIDIKKK